ncbi:MAG: Hsp20 family protein [Peptococcaceae bacterium]|jgi:HSP20 family molecular chaperone IbpA|nr:Hsp20 family protein [Peptococcaceae bacterium]
MTIDKGLIENLMELQKLAAGLDGKNWTQDLRGLVEMWQGMQGNVPQSWPSALWNQTTLPPEIHKPHISIMESDKDVTVTASLPGIKDSTDLAVRVKNDILQIIGRSSALSQPPDLPADIQAFCRTLNLPAEVQSKGAQATYQKGTIVIRLVKKNEPYDQIEVKFL